MSSTTLALIASSLAATLVLAMAAPAGTSQPSRIRTVHLNGVAAPAYYSVVEGGYRRVGGTPAIVAEVPPEQIAGIEATTPAN